MSGGAERMPTPERDEIAEKAGIQRDDVITQIDGKPVSTKAELSAALEAAKEAGLEDAVRPLIELRLADLDAREAIAPPPVPPAA